MSINSDTKTLLISLREKGLTYNEIALETGISKSSISYWLHNYIPSDEAQEILNDKNSKTAKDKSKKASIANQLKQSNNRKDAYNKGISRVFSEDSLYLICCMLYWGEGTKDKHSCRIVNSDPNMLKVFIKFLTTFFDMDKSEISIRLNFYNDLRLTEEIKSFWLKELDLPESCLKGMIINQYPKSSTKTRITKSEYGTCEVAVYKTKIVQEIYGGINEVINRYIK